MHLILAMSVSMALQLFDMLTTIWSHLAGHDGCTEYQRRAPTQRQRTAQHEVNLDRDGVVTADPLSEAAGGNGSDGRSGGYGDGSGSGGSTLGVAVGWDIAALQWMSVIHEGGLSL